jgi:hypothetical protein
MAEKEKAALPADIKDVFERVRTKLDGEPCELTDWEKQFCGDHLTRWDKFGDGIYLSQKQLEMIVKIAK